MNVQIQSVHFDADNKLIDHVTQKIQKLKTFNERIVNIEVYLKLDNVVHTIKDKVVEIKVSVPKHSYFVKQTSKTFEESFEAALNSMANRLKRSKEKMMAA